MKGHTQNTSPLALQYLQDERGLSPEIIQESQPPLTQLTVLTSFRKPLRKRYWISNDQVNAESYPQQTWYKSECVQIRGIDELGNLVSEISKNPHQLIIRGIREEATHHRTRRRKEHFKEPSEGSAWAMIDTDEFPLPENIDPLSLEAIEHFIAKLPSCFHDTTVFYQFSNSAGILNLDGSPYKNGLNVHLFYYFDRPLKNETLRVWLIDHCKKDPSLTFRQEGNKPDKFAIDQALFDDIQPHFTTVPQIGSDIQTRLQESQRQGFIKKAHDAVALPSEQEITPSEEAKPVKTIRRRLSTIQEGKGDLTTLDIVRLFKDQGLYIKPLGGNKHAITSPFGGTKESVKTSAIFEGEERCGNMKGKWPAYHSFRASEYGF